MTEKQARRWSIFRSKGKWVFVTAAAFLFALSQVLVRTTVDWYWGKSFGVDSVDILIYAALGLLVGFASWWGGEGRYMSFLLDQKIRDGLRGSNKSA